MVVVMMMMVVVVVVVKIMMVVVMMMIDDGDYDGDDNGDDGGDDDDADDGGDGDHGIEAGRMSMKSNASTTYKPTARPKTVNPVITSLFSLITLMYNIIQVHSYRLDWNVELQYNHLDVSVYYCRQINESASLIFNERPMYNNSSS
jgi:hypothetical protein